MHITCQTLLYNNIIPVHMHNASPIATPDKSIIAHAQFISPMFCTEIRTIPIGI